MHVRPVLKRFARDKSFKGRGVPPNRSSEFRSEITGREFFVVSPSARSAAERGRLAHLRSQKRADSFCEGTSPLPTDVLQIQRVASGRDSRQSWTIYTAVASQFNTIGVATRRCRHSWNYRRLLSEPRLLSLISR